MSLRRITYAVCMSSATALLASAVVFARMQTPPGQQMPNQQPQQTNPGVTPGPGAYPGTAPMGQDFGEKAFVTKAMEGHNAEVHSGILRS